MIGVKPEPLERADPLGELAALPALLFEQEKQRGQGEEGGDRTDFSSQEGRSGGCGINKDHLSKELWKTTAQCFRGPSKMSYEINNALSFLDELDRTELTLESSIFSLDLIQSVFIPKDTTPELTTRFIDFTEVTLLFHSSILPHFTFALKLEKRFGTAFSSDRTQHFIPKGFHKDCTE